ncbi:MAG: DNA primase [Nitrospiraceae bacterium]|nr:MAG: DNA primase [Nitrospiraceae bacterium]
MPSDRVLEEIKNRIDIVDLISEYVHLKHAGQNWKGLCPFHSEKTPSFTVSPSKQIYHCFGCNSGGDIFSFLLKYENVTFPEAVSMLAKKAGVTLKAAQKDTVWTGEKEVLLNMHRDAVSCFQQHLAKNAKADEYLTKRGITPEARKLFSLGYAPRAWDSLLTYLTRKGYKAEMIKKAGLVIQGTKGVYDTFRDRIMFPIYDLKGDVIAFGGRSIDGDEPKYLNSPETIIFNKRRVLYGLNQAREPIKKEGRAIFMEGYLDVITAHLHGFTNSVAPLGTAFTQEHGKLIKRFVEDVILAFDNDEAGRKAAGNAASILLEAGLNVKILSCPENEDPDSLLRKKGKEAFQELLQEPLTIIDFYMLQKQDKRLTARQAIETISRIPDRILQGYYVKLLSERLRVNEFFIIEELKKLKKTGKGENDKTPLKPSARTKPLNEVYIIKLLLQLPERADEISGFISAEDFRDPATRAVFGKIKEGVRDFNELLSQCEGEEKDFLTEVSMREDIENPDKALEDCMNRISGNKRKLLLQELQNKIREAESKKDFNLLKSLQTEQHKLLRIRGNP